MAPTFRRGLQSKIETHDKHFTKERSILYPGLGPEMQWPSRLLCFKRLLVIAASVRWCRFLRLTVCFDWNKQANLNRYLNNANNLVMLSNHNAFRPPPFGNTWLKILQLHRQAWLKQSVWEQRLAQHPGIKKCLFSLSTKYAFCSQYQKLKLNHNFGILYVFSTIVYFLYSIYLFSLRILYIACFLFSQNRFHLRLCETLQVSRSNCSFPPLKRPTDHPHLLPLFNLPRWEQMASQKRPLKESKAMLGFAAL